MVKLIISRSELLAERVDPDYFYTAISHASPRVNALAWDAPRDALTLEFNGSEQEATDFIGLIKAKIGRSVVNKGLEVVYTHAAQEPLKKRDVWRELLAGGMVKDWGQGHVSYGGLFYELVQRLDSLLYAIARRQGAEPVQLPGFIPLAYLQQLGSFEQYPHHLYFPSPLVADLERIEAFQQAAGSEVEVGAYLSAPAYCLKASACAPLYPTIKNKEFQAYAYYTMLGACTRHEALNTTSFERLTEFQMREIVYIGDSDGDHDFRRFALGLCQNLIECFDLPAQITTANDSFFISNYSRFKLMQLLGHDKFEAKVLIADTGAEVAFGSLNHHRNFFGKRFGFRYRGETATSACVGFGLERLAYGILCRHGLQESRVFSMLDHLQARYDLIAQA